MGFEWSKEEQTCFGDEMSHEMICSHLDKMANDTDMFRTPYKSLWPDAVDDDGDGVSFLKGRMYAIDGLIGVGKTTLGTQLKELLGPLEAAFMPEHVDPAWLKLFYGHEKERAGVFQVNQLAQCVAGTKVIAEKCRQGMIGIVDRSPLGNACFAFLHYLWENIDEDLFVCYLRTLLGAGPYLYAHIVFLYAPVEVIQKRIKARHVMDDDRESEHSGVSLAYLRALDEMMLFVFLYMHASGNMRVIFVDWTDYGDEHKVLALLTQSERPSSSSPGQRDQELLDKIVNADYPKLRIIVSELCVDARKKTEQ